MIRARTQYLLQRSDFSTRQRIIFRRLSSKEQLYIRLKEANSDDRFLIALQLGVVPVAKYYLEKNEYTAQTINYILQNKTDLYYHPKILKLFIAADQVQNINSKLSCEIILNIIFNLYKNLLRHGREILSENQHRINMLIISGALLKLSYGMEIFEDILIRDWVQENMPLFNKFKTSVSETEVDLNSFGIQACNPDVFCLITAESRRRIHLYETTQLSDIDFSNTAYQLYSSVCGFFLPAYFYVKK